VYVTALHDLVEATRVLQQAEYGPAFLDALDKNQQAQAKHGTARRAFEDHRKIHGC
jgi:hypothetical protein